MNRLNFPLIGFCGECKIWFSLQPNVPKLPRHSNSKTGAVCCCSYNAPTEFGYDFKTDEDLSAAYVCIIDDADNYKRRFDKVEVPPKRSMDGETEPDERHLIANGVIAYGQTEQNQKKCVA